MNMKNFGGNTPKSNEPENPGRRGFLRGALAGTLAAGLVGALGVKGINRYVEEENQSKELFSHFEGKEKEEDFGLANEAAGLLVYEMNRLNIESVKLSGTGHPNRHIEILRDFLTSHINSPVGHKYPFRSELLSSGVYTKDSLDDILKASSELSGSAK